MSPFRIVALALMLQLVASAPVRAQPGPDADVSDTGQTPPRPGLRDRLHDLGERVGRKVRDETHASETRVVEGVRERARAVEESVGRRVVHRLSRSWSLVAAVVLGLVSLVSAVTTAVVVLLTRRRPRNV